MPTQLPRVPSLIPSSFATRAIGRDASITIFTASSLNSGEKLFFGRGNYFTFPDVHPIGWAVRKARGTSGGQAVGGDLVVTAVRDAFDDLAVAEPAQVVADLAAGHVLWRLPELGGRGSAAGRGW